MESFEELIWLFTSNYHSRGIVRLNIAEGALLYKYCRRKHDGVLLEIGRKFGGSTRIMSAALSSGFLYSVDIDSRPEVDENIKGYEDKVNIITGDSRQIDWNAQIDLLFVDGDHSYTGVKNDIDKFSPFVSNGGYLIMHDVVGMKSELRPIINKLVKNNWSIVDNADSMLVLLREK